MRGVLTEEEFWRARGSLLSKGALWDADNPPWTLPPPSRN